MDSCQEPPPLPQGRPASQADQGLTGSHGLRAVFFFLPGDCPGHKVYFGVEAVAWPQEGGRSAKRTLGRDVRSYSAAGRTLKGQTLHLALTPCDRGHTLCFRWYGFSPCGFCPLTSAQTNQISLPVWCFPPSRQLRPGLCFGTIVGLSVDGNPQPLSLGPEDGAKWDHQAPSRNSCLRARVSHSCPRGARIPVEPQKFPPEVAPRDPRPAHFTDEEAEAQRREWTGPR